MLGYSSSICPGCDEPFFAGDRARIPKHLHCSHSFCLGCLQRHCLSQCGHAVYCPACNKQTQLSFIGDCENSLVTNFHALQQKSSTTASNNNNSARGRSGGGGICESPLACGNKATGRCNGCGGAGFCAPCHAAHIQNLPVNVRGSHSLRSVSVASESSASAAAASATMSVCEPHGLPQQLFCTKHNKAVCPTCAQLHHRDPDCEIHELKSVVSVLRPQIEERQGKMRALFDSALTSCYQIQQEMKQLDTDTEKTISNLFRDAAECVDRTYSMIYSVQQAAIDRRAQLEHALIGISAEAGDFAEEVHEIRDLFESSGDGNPPDPIKVARHAPTDVTEIRTVIPPGETIEAKLCFDVKNDVYKHWARRGAQGPPPKRWGGRAIAVANAAGMAVIAPTPMKFVFGSCQGTSENQFNYPGGIAVLPNGNLVVCDTYNNRLQFLEASSGRFLGFVPVFRSVAGEQQRQRGSLSPSSSASPLSVVKTTAPPMTTYAAMMSGTSTSTVAERRSVSSAARPASLSPPHNQNQQQQHSFENAATGVGNSNSQHHHHHIAPGTPALVTVLRNGLLFVLDVENKCTYFVDPDRMVQLVHKSSSSSSPSNGDDGCSNKNTAAVGGTDGEGDEVGRWPTQWQEPAGMCMLPWSDEVAIIDKARHVVSVIAGKDLSNSSGSGSGGSGKGEQGTNKNNNNNSSRVEREFDGVDTVIVNTASVPPRTNSPLASRISSHHHPHGHAAVSMVHEDFVHRVAAPVAMCVVPSPGGFEAFKDDRGDDDNGGQQHLDDQQQQQQQNHHHQRRLVAVCSEKYVALLDARSGDFVRFVGGDASAQRPFGRPWGICASCDGKRLAVVDAAHSCIFVCQVSDGAVLGRINVDSRIYPQHAAVLPMTGQIVVTDCVSHTVNVLDAVL